MMWSRSYSHSSRKEQRDESEGRQWCSRRIATTAAVIIAAITSTRTQANLPCKVTVRKDSPSGRTAGLRLDSVVDCQTMARCQRKKSS